MHNRTQSNLFYSALLFFCTFLGFILPSYSLAQQKDFGMWHGISLERKLSQIYSVSFTEQVRLENNALQIKSVFANLAFTYHGWYNLRYILHYRYSIGLKKSKHRLAGDMIYKLKREKIRTTFNFRLRTLMESSPQDRGEPNDFYMRTKVTAKYNDDFWGFTPFASMELFFRVNHRERETDKFRMGLGATYDLTKRNTLKIAYLFQKEKNVPDRKNVNILYLSLSVDLDPKKKKDKKVDDGESLIEDGELRMEN